MPWIYRQNTGRIEHDGTLAGVGYSGRGRGKNNPSRQNEAMIGPIPRGTWTIGAPFTHPHAGPYAMRLTPTHTFTWHCYLPPLRLHDSRRQHRSSGRCVRRLRDRQYRHAPVHLGKRRPHDRGDPVRAAAIVAMLTAPALCFAGSPSQCASWPKNITPLILKNVGITDPVKIDDSKTKAVRIASEKIGKDLWRDVYDITFYEQTGHAIEVITSSEASSAECSMSDPVVWVVTQKIDIK